MSSRHDQTSFTRSTRTCAVARTAHRVGGVPGPFRLDLPSALPLPVARGHPAQVGRELDVRDPLDGLRLLNVLGPAGETERDGAGAWRHRNTRRHHHPGRAARLPNAAARPPASGGGHRPSPRCPTPPGFPPGGPGVSCHRPDRGPARGVRLPASPRRGRPRGHGLAPSPNHRRRHRSATRPTRVGHPARPGTRPHGRAPTCGCHRPLAGDHAREVIRWVRDRREPCCDGPERDPGCGRRGPGRSTAPPRGGAPPRRGRAGARDRRQT